MDCAGPVRPRWSEVVLAAMADVRVATPAGI